LELKRIIFTSKRIIFTSKNLSVLRTHGEYFSDPIVELAHQMPLKLLGHVAGSDGWELDQEHHSQAIGLLSDLAPHAANDESALCTGYIPSIALRKRDPSTREVKSSKRIKSWERLGDPPMVSITSWVFSPTLAR